MPPAKQRAHASQDDMAAYFGVVLAVAGEDQEEEEAAFRISANPAAGTADKGLGE